MAFLSFCLAHSPFKLFLSLHILMTMYSKRVWWEEDNFCSVKLTNFSCDFSTVADVDASGSFNNGQLLRMCSDLLDTQYLKCRL